MSDIDLIKSSSKEQQSTIDSLNRSLADLAKRLDEMPDKIQPLKSEFSALAQISRTIESIQMAKYFTGVANSALDTTKALSSVYKSQKGLINIGSSLLGVLGGPVGLAITVASVAASFLSFEDSTKNSIDNLDNLCGSVDNLIERYHKLNLAKQRAEKDKLSGELDIIRSNIKNNTDSTFSNVNTDTLSHSDIEDIYNQGMNGTIDNTKLDEYNRISEEISKAKQNIAAVINDKIDVNEKIIALDKIHKSFADIIPLSEENKKVMSDSFNELIKLVDLESDRASILDGMNDPNYLVKLSYESTLKSLNDQKATLQDITTLEKLRHQFLDGNALSKLDKDKQAELVLLAKEIDAEKEKRQQQEQYAALQASLLTNEELLVQKISERLQTINNSSASDKEKQQMVGRVLDDAFVDAPEFSNTGDLGSIASSEEELTTWYESQLTLLDEYRQKHFELNDQWNEKDKALTQTYEEQLTQIKDAELRSQFSMAGDFFDSMTNVAKDFAGEQSGVYKAMFAVSKGFSIANATLSLYDSIAGAIKVGFPQNIPLIAQAMSQGVSLISSIKGTNISGQAHDGIDYIPREGTWLLDKGERVLSPRQNADFTNFIANNGQGDVPQIIINNNVGAQISASYDEREDIIKIAVNRAVNQVSNELSSGTGTTSRALRTRWNTNTKTD